jgi:hypothetical protein
MRDISLPEFGTPDDFVDLCDIVKSYFEQDSSWVANRVVHGTLDQRSSHVAAVKCQNRQVLGTGSGDKRYYVGPNGTT